VKTFRAHVREHYQRAPLRRSRTRCDDDAARAGAVRDGPLPAPPGVGQLLPLRAAGGRVRAAVVHGLGPSPARGAQRSAARLTWLRDMAAIYGPYAESRARFVAVQRAAGVAALSPADRATFPFDVRDLDWNATCTRCTSPAWSASCCGMRGRAAPVDLSPRRRATEPPRRPIAPSRRPAADDAGRRRAGARSSWRGAEQVLAVTRETSPPRRRVWTTPTYKRVIRRASLHAIRVAARVRLGWPGRAASTCRSAAPSSWWPTTPATSTPACCWPRWGTTRTAPTHRRGRLLVPPARRRLDPARHARRHPLRPHRRNVARALALPAQVLRNGHSLIFFPEGTRSLDGRCSRSAAPSGCWRSPRRRRSSRSHHRRRAGAPEGARLDRAPPRPRPLRPAHRDRALPAAPGPGERRQRLEAPRARRARRRRGLGRSLGTLAARRLRP
jgi:hypothetical protein